MFCFCLMNMQCSLLRPFCVAPSIKGRVKLARFNLYAPVWAKIVLNIDDFWSNSFAQSTVFLCFLIQNFLAGLKVWQTRLSLRTQFPSFSLPFIIRYQSTALLHIFYVQAVHKKFNMHLSQSSTSGMFFKKFKRNIVCEQIIRGVTAL